MKIIQHRVDGDSKSLSPYAEVDVHINHFGHVVIGHDPDDLINYDEFTYVADVYDKHDKFFVDIKQNLPLKHLKKIVDVFGNKLLGIFDVPWPSAFYAQKDKIAPIYHRVSDYESPFPFGSAFWIDPIGTNFAPFDYDRILINTFIAIAGRSSKFIVACPSLHGYDLKATVSVWEFIRAAQKIGQEIAVEGIVTKFTEEAKEFFKCSR